MSILITLLTIFMVVVSLLLILITLMQRPKQEGLGAAFGGGMTDQMFGAQTTDVLQKGTIWLTVAFFVTAILLTVLNTKQFEKQRDVGNVLENVKPEPLPTLPTPGTTPSLDIPESGTPLDAGKAATDSKSKPDTPEKDPEAAPDKSSEKTPATDKPGEKKVEDNQEKQADKAKEKQPAKADQKDSSKPSPEKKED